MRPLPLRVFVPLALMAATGAPAPALAQEQESFPACETQQEMEQVIQSQGELMPDGCRTVTITPVDTPAGELCALEFEAEDPGIVGAITEAAVPTQWWMACADIERP